MFNPCFGSTCSPELNDRMNSTHNFRQDFYEEFLNWDFVFRWLFSWLCDTGTISCAALHMYLLCVPFHPEFDLLHGLFGQVHLINIMSETNKVPQPSESKHASGYKQKIKCYYCSPAKLREDNIFSRVYLSTGLYRLRPQPSLCIGPTPRTCSNLFTIQPTLSERRVAGIRLKCLVIIVEVQWFPLAIKIFGGQWRIQDFLGEGSNAWGHQSNLWPKVSWNLHANNRNWTKRGDCPLAPWIQRRQISVKKIASISSQLMSETFLRKSLALYR